MLNDTKKKHCAKCLYKSGVVEMLVNPCPQCRRNGYDSYEWFQKLWRQGIDPKNRNK